jgi:hypothetical protein
VFGSKREESTRGCRKLNSEMLCNLNFSSVINRKIEERDMRGWRV